MTLYEWAKYKNPDTHNERLLNVLAEIEVFNPKLPKFVEVTVPQSTRSYRKMMRRATRKHGAK